ELTIIDAIQNGEEKMLPGLGVLFELIWKQSAEDQRQDMIEALELGVKQSQVTYNHIDMILRGTLSSNSIFVFKFFYQQILFHFVIFHLISSIDNNILSFIINSSQNHSMYLVLFSSRLSSNIIIYYSCFIPIL